MRFYSFANGRNATVLLLVEKSDARAADFVVRTGSEDAGIGITSVLRDSEPCATVALHALHRFGVPSGTTAEAAFKSSADVTQAQKMKDAYMRHAAKRTRADTRGTSVRPSLHGWHDHQQENNFSGLFFHRPRKRGYHEARETNMIVM
jgi:hypothetical protein